jgi:hypothetical protein
MLELFKKSLVSQFEAGLFMLDDCVRRCRDEHWDGAVAKYPFWQVAYHALCFADLYLSPSEQAFTFRAELHPQGQREFDEEYPSRRFARDELVAYVAICRGKAIETIAAETSETLSSPSASLGLKFSRLELHLYNLRHLQHHVGQLGAY